MSSAAVVIGALRVNLLFIILFIRCDTDDDCGDDSDEQNCPSKFDNICLLVFNVTRHQRHIEATPVEPV